MHKIINKTVGNVYHLEQMVDDFFPYAQKRLGFDKPVTIIFQSDKDNATKMLGKTAYYDPTSHEVVVYTDGRHPKDVMRSLSHELVHHAQNCRGDFDNSTPTYSGYAQEDPHLRNMEKEAFEKGCMMLRDWEDGIGTGKRTIKIDFSESGDNNFMSLKEWKNNEINTKLMKKWRLLKEEKFPDLTGDGEVTQADILHGRGVDLDEAELGEKYSVGDQVMVKLDDGRFVPGKVTHRRNAGRPSGYFVRADVDGRAYEMWIDDESRLSLARPSLSESSDELTLQEAKEVTRRILERVAKEIE